MGGNDWPPGLSCPRCVTANGFGGRKYNCGCRCDCHARGFTLYNLPNETIDPIRLSWHGDRSVFAQLAADWVRVTGTRDGTGSGIAGIRLDLTPDEVAWRTQRGLTIHISPEHFQAWHQALADARRPQRKD